ncbi:MAG: hypothetical protein AUH85_02265 [Chloroflexi bacterium 13_1_40CM_4_68_4]|nr:MAG: hypothetical protein AUH85_02265 [Chloroflexi bacterium 13_1_40CM_4_68_4]
MEANPNRLSARDWFAGVLAGAAGQQLDDVRVGGRDALRVRNGIFGSLAYVTTSADRAFVVALVPGQAAPPPTASDSYLDAMAASLETLAPVALAAPPAAVTTAEPFADALADAFARRDVDRLGSLVVPTCWFTSAVANAGPSGIHPQAMLDDLRVRFAQGLTVSVRARPVEGDPARPPLSIRSTWVEAAGASSRGASLLLWRQDGRWYWSGVVFDR